MRRRRFLRALTGAGLATVAGTSPGAGRRALAQQPSPPPAATPPPLVLPLWIASVGDPEVLLTKPDLVRLELNSWPDGNFGVLHSGPAYTFFAANRQHVARTTGTLANPAAGSVQQDIAIRNLKHPYDYAGGGPVYQDPASGALLLFYHSERWPNGDFMKFYSTIGMALSRDAGMSWTDLGEIVSPTVPYGSLDSPTDVGGGSFLVIDGFFYLYFRDRIDDGHINNLAVARAAIADVVAAALGADDVVPWAKYNGGWAEPGLGGMSRQIQEGNRPGLFTNFAYDSSLGVYLLLGTSAPTVSSRQLFLARSSDPLAWPVSQQLTQDPGWDFYPTIISPGDDPKQPAGSFYVYYLYSLAGAFRLHSDGVLQRRLIVLAPAPAAP